jgi:hypothetical protein
LSNRSGYSFHIRFIGPRATALYLRLQIGSRTADIDMRTSATRVVHRYVQLEKKQEASGISRAEPSSQPLVFTPSETVASLSRTAIDVRRGSGGHGV